MKTVFQLKAIAGLAVALLISTASYAQKVVLSPRDSVSGKIGAATVSINYGAPSLRGRKILGSIEPYGKAWRAGANQATTFTTSAAITIDGKKLPAGKYSLYMVPGETEWKVIFNSEIPSWGIKKGPGNIVANDPAKDVLSVTVKPTSHEVTERLKYEIDNKGFALVWENVSVPVAIK